MSKFSPKTKQAVLKFCKKCRKSKFFSEFYLVDHTHLSKFCKECTNTNKSKKQFREVNQHAKNYLAFYFSLPTKHLIPTDNSCLAIYAAISELKLQKYLDLHNELYETNYTIQAVRHFLSDHKRNIWRYITYKQCRLCKEWKQVYEQSDNPEIVFLTLANLKFRPIHLNFKYKPMKKDNLSDTCLACESTTPRKIPPWQLNVT